MCPLPNSCKLRPADISGFLSKYKACMQFIADDTDLNTVKYQRKFQNFMKKILLSKKKKKKKCTNSKWVYGASLLITNWLEHAEGCQWPTW